MTTAVFDTLKASDNLKAAGVEAKQAEAIVHTMAAAFEDTVATKADIVSVRSDLIEVKAELKQEIAGVKTELKQEIAGVKADIKLLKWMIGVVLACVAFPILKSFLV
jgi:hypothetical protein